MYTSRHRVDVARRERTAVHKLWRYSAVALEALVIAWLGGCLPPPPPLFRLIVRTTGNGTVSPDGGTYEGGATVTLKASASDGWIFAGWQSDLTGSENPKNIQINRDMTVTAVFSNVGGRTLTVLKTGEGSVSPNSGTYTDGSSLSFVATPSEGWVFDKWQGDLTGSENPKNIQINRDMTVTAVFSNVGGRTLTILKIGEGSVSPNSGTYAEGSVLSLRATPSEGWTFDKWQGDLQDQNNPHSLVMDGDKVVMVVFTRTCDPNSDPNCSGHTSTCNPSSPAFPFCLLAGGGTGGDPCRPPDPPADPNDDPNCDKGTWVGTLKCSMDSMGTIAWTNDCGDCEREQELTHVLDCSTTLSVDLTLNGCIRGQALEATGTSTVANNTTGFWYSPRCGHCSSGGKNATVINGTCGIVASDVSIYFFPQETVGASAFPVTIEVFVDRHGAQTSATTVTSWNCSGENTDSFELPAPFTSMRARLQGIYYRRPGGLDYIEATRSGKPVDMCFAVYSRDPTSCDCVSTIAAREEWTLKLTRHP